MASRNYSRSSGLPVAWGFTPDDRSNMTVYGSNYFRLGTLSRAYRRVDDHAQSRLRSWLVAMTGRPGIGTRAYSNQLLYGLLGLTQLEGPRRRNSQAERAV
jgi:hypothetical protein